MRIDKGAVLILSAEDYATCVKEAHQRMRACRKAGLTDRFKSRLRDDREAEDINGCCAELAWARALGGEWTARQGFDAVDVEALGMKFEVKSTPYETGSLIVTPREVGSLGPMLVVLLTGQGCRFVFRGCIAGHWAGLRQYFRAPDGYRVHDPSFWVPQSDLRAFDSHTREMWRNPPIEQKTCQNRLTPCG